MELLQHAADVGHVVLHEL